MTKIANANPFSRARSLIKCCMHSKSLNKSHHSLQKHLTLLEPKGHPFARTVSWQEFLSSFMKTHFFPSTAGQLSQI